MLNSKAVVASYKNNMDREGGTQFMDMADEASALLMVRVEINIYLFT